MRVEKSFSAAGKARQLAGHLKDVHDMTMLRLILFTYIKKVQRTWIVLSLLSRFWPLANVMFMNRLPH